jgi:hypothetical protein
MTRSRSPLLLLALACLASLVIFGPLAAGEKKGTPEKKTKEFTPIKIDGQLAETDPKDKKLDQPCKLHKVDLAKGKTYVIDLIGKGFDAYLRLEDPDGKQVAEDDDSGGALNARITYSPVVSGSFQISATTLNGAVGPYTLQVREVDPAKEGKIKLGKALEIGADGIKIDSKIDNANDPKSPVEPKHPCKVFSFKMKANQKYVIDMEGNNGFDSYLHVLDENLKSLADDDDSGGNLNAQITFTAPNDGTYHILATTFDGQDGPFTLRIRINKD